MLISKYGNGTVSQVEELEMKLGIKLDEKYKAFLIKYNGGDTPNTNWNGKCKSDVRFFYGIGVKEDILESLKYEIVQNLLEKSFLPIAKNCSGDFFCINLEDAKIYFSYHDKNRITLIAESFEEFISKIPKYLLLPQFRKRNAHRFCTSRSSLYSEYRRHYI